MRGAKERESYLPTPSYRFFWCVRERAGGEEGEGRKVGEEGEEGRQGGAKERERATSLPRSAASASVRGREWEPGRVREGRVRGECECVKGGARGWKERESEKGLYIPAYLSHTPKETGWEGFSLNREPSMSSSAT